jgi:hypothetical protein
MSKALYFWSLATGEFQSSPDLEVLSPACPCCASNEVSPLGSEDLAPPSFHGADPDRIFFCAACGTIYPLRVSVHLQGFLVTPLPPLLHGEKRKQLLDLMKEVFKQSHHPWRQLLETESKYPDFRLAELPDLRQMMETKGELGGGIACPDCGKKPLAPHPDPACATAFATQVRIYFPCPACPSCTLHHYSWNVASSSVQLETEDASGLRQEVEFYRLLEAKLVNEELKGFWAAALPQQTQAVMQKPGSQRLLRAARLAAGAEPPEADMPQDQPQPLLRRLGKASPLFHPESWSVSCEQSPRLRLRGGILQELGKEMQAKAAKQGPASVLEDLARWNQALPFLIKTPPITQALGQALMDLRRRLREAGVHLLPVACHEGILLIDPKSGEIHYRLPHMQAKDLKPPVALGFTNRMVYYQEPGVLSITGHPIVAGTAWRTDLENPLIRWVDLGRYTVVETEAGLSELSGQSGRVRWTRTREELGGLLTWTIQAGSLVTASEDTLFVLDPASGEILEQEALPKRSRFVALVHGDLPAPVAVVDQGYGPGLFAPRFEEFKGGVKPLAVPQEGSDQLAFALCHQGQIFTLWETDVGYSDRSVLVGPIEKKFAAKAVSLETKLADTPLLVYRSEANSVVVPGEPVAVISCESGEILHILEVDGRLGLREFHGILLAFGKDSLAALAPKTGKVLWQLDLPGVQAADMPGPQMTPEEFRPGYQAQE